MVRKCDGKRRAAETATMINNRGTTKTGPEKRRQNLLGKLQPAFGLTSAANTILLPKPKPRAVRKHLVMPSIRSREVARLERSSVRQREEALKTFDFGNGLLGVH